VTPTPHLDDDGLSAVLDGLGDPGETEHARDCVECQDRLAQWDAARKLVGTPVPPAPEDVRRAAIAAATHAATPSRSAPVPLFRRPGLARSVTGIAAALLIAGVAYAAAHNSNHGSAKSTAATRPPGHASTATSAANSSGGAAGSVSGISNGPAGASSSRPGISLGSFTSPQPLVAALKQQLVRPASLSPNAVASPLPACDAQAATAAHNPRSGPILSEPLTYANTPAQVYVYPRPGGDVAVVMSGSHCQLLTTANF
jgi:hypothetical protein